MSTTDRVFIIKCNGALTIVKHAIDKQRPVLASSEKAARGYCKRMHPGVPVVSVNA